MGLKFTSAEMNRFILDHGLLLSSVYFIEVPYCSVVVKTAKIVSVMLK